ncbi:MAG: ribonuclease R [Fastidiosipilaceae bacterium]
MPEYVGILRPFERGGVVDTGDAGVGEIWVPETDLGGAPFGMKVVCEAGPVVANQITKGRVVEVLGDPSQPDVAIQGIIRAYGLRERFPDAVLTEADKFPDELSEELIQSEIRLGRKDLRTLRTLTIDGLDAKDLDDAISIERLPKQLLKLYVHIADVTHYVKEGSAVDREALRRGTSVYLVDRVLPMQPPQLSNGICSLNPRQDRLTLTAAMVFDATGTMRSGEIFESVIRSDVRGNYDDVWTMIQDGKPVPGYESLFDDLMLMHDLSRKLRAARLVRGSLDFNFPETKIELDDEGRPIDIHAVPITEANELIEEFMITANIFVAREFEMKQAPFIYRVHEDPDPEGVERFYSVAKRVGMTLRKPREVTSRSLSAALQEIKSHEYNETLSQLLLRSLAKARYDQNCLGHFGLGLKYYCHFTSPIRRYPDLFIHRVIKGYLRGNPRVKTWKIRAPEVAEHSSLTERSAMMAERDSVDQKVAEYMSLHLGERFLGRISGMTSAGMFVRLENTAEGMIPFRTLNDYYVFSEEQMLVQGEASRRVFRIGDQVTVVVARADIINRQVDFELPNENLGTVEERKIDQEELARIREAAERRREERLRTVPVRPGSQDFMPQGKKQRSDGHCGTKGERRTKKAKPRKSSGRTGNSRSKSSGGKRGKQRQPGKNSAPKRRGDRR